MTGRKVLVPLDGSEFSGQIVPCLLAWLEAEQIDEIILLGVADEAIHAQTPLPAIPMEDAWQEPSYRSRHDIIAAKHPIYANQVRDSVEAALQAALRHQADPLRQAGFKVSLAVKFGDPIEEIPKFIKTAEIGLVAMTTHGRTGLGRLLFGSVAEGVLHEISVPILLLRPYPAESETDASIEDYIPFV